MLSWFGIHGGKVGSKEKIKSPNVVCGQTRKVCHGFVMGMLSKSSSLKFLSKFWSLKILLLFPKWNLSNSLGGNGSF